MVTILIAYVPTAGGGIITTTYQGQTQSQATALITAAAAAGIIMRIEYKKH